MDIQRIQPGEWNSRAVVYGNLVFVSGIVADDKSLPIKGQTEQVLQKIDVILAAAGTDKSRLLSATVYLADAKLREGINEIWMAWIDKKNLPARAALTPGTLVEIVVTAARE